MRKAPNNNNNNNGNGNSTCNNNGNNNCNNNFNNINGKINISARNILKKISKLNLEESIKI